MTPRFAFYTSQPTIAQWKAALDNFAELLSLDFPLDEIARRMDVTRGTACALLTMLCELMGERVS